MPDNPPARTPSEPASREVPKKKMTTQVLSIKPVDDSATTPTPKTIPLKRSSTAVINIAGASSRPAPAGKKDTARLDNNSTVARDANPKSATTPLVGIPRQPTTDRKSETIRISLADILPALKKPVAGKQATTPITEPTTTAAPGPPTIQLKRPPTVPITIIPDAGMKPPAKVKTSPVETPTVTRPAKDDGKKRTTRLILDATAVSAEASHMTSPITVIPQTIRLKRPGMGTSSAPTKAKVRTDLISKAPTVVRTPPVTQAKMTTSRIMVEETAPVSASPSPGELKRRTSPIPTSPGAVATPHTIRLKRPSSAAMEEESTIGPAAEVPTVMKAKKAETTKIDLPKDAEAVPITQRKTIKIKRTERNVAPRTVMLKHPSPTAAADAIQPEAAAAVTDEADLISPLFFGLAAAAVVLIGCLVYVMAAQAFGPELVLPVPASLL